MTTIVASRKGMAGDTQTSSDGVKSNMTKVFKTKKGLVGFAGDVTNGMQFVEWFKDHRRKEPSMEGTDALVVNRKGEILHFCESLTPVPVNDDFFAIGSGALAALASMHHKQDLETAVRVASKFDPNTGGHVDLIEL